MRQLITIALLMLNGLIAHAQQVDVTRDAGIWFAAGLERKLTGKLELDFGQEVRLYHNASRVDDYISELGLSYRINRNFALGGGFRYTYNIHRDGSLGHDLRYHGDIGYRGRLTEKFRIGYRLRFQKEYANQLDSTGVNDYNTMDFRHRLKIEYLHSQRHTFFVSGEAFRTLKQFREPYFGKLRFFAGDDINLGTGVIELSLGMGQELNKERPLSFGFVAVSYVFTWKR